jgi:hypothetical protein
MFSRELQELLAAPTSTRELRSAITRLSDDSKPEWQDAKIVKSGRGAERAVLESKDGKVTLHVASPYFDYIHERYPGARLRIKNNLSPVLFKVGATVRACVMPVEMPADELLLRNIRWSISPKPRTCMKRVRTEK